MKLIVCVKQIPDPSTLPTLGESNHWLIRPDDQVLDDADRYGVEVALRLADKTGGSVKGISMGPTGSAHGIRQALAMGVDEALVIEDDGLKGSDALTTARVLARAISEESFDLVIAGTESTDGYAGVVPQMVAELLAVPALTYARSVEVDGSVVTIQRQTNTGFDVVRSELPALITVTAGAIEPRYPTFKGMMEAKRKPISIKGLSHLGVDVATSQIITSRADVPERSAGRLIEDNGEAYREVISLLRERGLIPS